MRGTESAGAQAPQLILQTGGKKAGTALASGKGCLPLALWLAQFSTDLSLHAPQALRSLKAKQRTEKRIEALHAKLDTVQGILDRIYASQTDQMVAIAPYSSAQLVSPWVLVTCSFGFAVWRIPGFFRDVAGVAFAFPVRRFGLSGYRVY